MTLVAATKYVALADMGVLADAGIEVVGENRAQELERKHAEYAGISSGICSRTRSRS